jgi:hypothetical protein
VIVLAAVTSVQCSDSAKAPAPVKGNVVQITTRAQGWAEYRAARALAIDMAQLSKDARVSRAQRETLTQDYGVLAVGLLQQAVAQGLPGYRRMFRQDPALVALHHLPEFQQLIRE